MVIILNYLPWLIAGVALYVAARAKTTRSRVNAVAVAIASIVVFMAASSYTPKGVASRAALPNPAFEQSTAEAQDRLRAPSATPEQRSEQLNQSIDWKQQIAQ